MPRHWHQQQQRQQGQQKHWLKRGQGAALRPLRHTPVCSAGATVNVGVDPSKCVITKLKMDKDRKKILERKVSVQAFSLGSKCGSTTKPPTAASNSKDEQEGGGCPSPRNHGA